MAAADKIGRPYGFVDTIDFVDAAPTTAIATFGRQQFGPGKIGPSVLIDRNDGIVVNCPIAGFDASDFILKTAGGYGQVGASGGSGQVARVTAIDAVCSTMPTITPASLSSPPSSTSSGPPELPKFVSQSVKRCVPSR